jgi:hypothetical protein
MGGWVCSLRGRTEEMWRALFGFRLRFYFLMRHHIMAGNVGMNDLGHNEHMDGGLDGWMDCRV